MSRAVRNPHHRYGNSRAIRDHTVLPVTRQRWHSRLELDCTWKWTLNSLHKFKSSLNSIDLLSLVHRSLFIPSLCYYVHGFFVFVWLYVLMGFGKCSYFARLFCSPMFLLQCEAEKKQFCFMNKSFNTQRNFTKFSTLIPFLLDGRMNSVIDVTYLISGIFTKFRRLLCNECDYQLSNEINDYRLVLVSISLLRKILNTCKK